MTLGWLVEGVVLTVADTSRSSGTSSAPAGASPPVRILLYLFDFIPFVYGMAGVLYFKLKYASVIAGMVLIMVLYLRAMARGEIGRHSRTGALITGYKYFTVASFWVFLLITASITTTSSSRGSRKRTGDHPERVVLPGHDRRRHPHRLAYGLSKFRLAYDRSCRPSTSFSTRWPF